MARIAERALPPPHPQAARALAVPRAPPPPARRAAAAAAAAGGALSATSWEAPFHQCDASPRQ